MRTRPQLPRVWRLPASRRRVSRSSSKGSKHVGTSKPESDPGDRRKTVIQMTDCGEKLLHAVLETREAWLARAIEAAVLPDEQADLERAIVVLEKLRRRMSPGVTTPESPRAARSNSARSGRSMPLKSNTSSSVMASASGVSPAFTGCIVVRDSCRFDRRNQMRNFKPRQSFSVNVPRPPMTIISVGMRPRQSTFFTSRRGSRVLELAIGTGRIGLPLARRGLDVQGIELSEAMVAQLRRKPGGDAIPVTLATMLTSGWRARIR